MWDVSKSQLLLTLKGHNGAVFSVDMDEQANIVLTGSADKVIQLKDNALLELRK